jgi:uncharacterized protein
MSSGATAKGNMPVFRHRTELDHPVEEVFAWHRRPGALERLTPPWEEVRVLEREGGIDPGGRVVLGIRQGPATVRWEIAHTHLEENRLFVDEQVRGPFNRWRHEHRFEARDGGASTLEDVIEWEPPLGAIGESFAGATIERKLRRLVGFRARRLRNDLALHRRFSDRPRLTVGITGSTGMIGADLSHFLAGGGHRVVRMRRTTRPSPEEIGWDPDDGRLDPSDLEGLDAVVHLAAEPIAGVRWTGAKKERIMSSRELGTRLLAKAMRSADAGPRVLVSASGVDYYGARGDEVVTERTGPGEGFLAEVARRWERAAHPAVEAGIRTVFLRSGPVLSPRGGMLGAMLRPFRMGLGGRVGSGRQYLSWIDLDDEVALIHHALNSSAVSGPMNATAPNPVPNASFTDVLGRVLGRPTILPLPAFAVRSLMGEMGRELLLEGARVHPERALATGYRFLFPDLEDSLRHQLGREEPEA